MILKSTIQKNFIWQLIFFFYKGAKGILWKIDGLFNKQCWNNLKLICDNLDSNLIPIQKEKVKTDHRTECKI